MTTDDRAFPDLDDLTAEYAKARQVLDALDEISTELRGFQYMLEMYIRAFKERFPKHRAVLAEITHEHKKVGYWYCNIASYQRKYKAKIENFEHKYGAVEYKKLSSLAPICMSLLEVLDEYGWKLEEVDFLDEPGELHARSRTSVE